MFSKLPALMKPGLRPTHGYQDTQGRMPGVTLPFPHQWYVMQLIQHEYIVNVFVRGIKRNRRTSRVSIFDLVIRNQQLLLKICRLYFVEHNNAADSI